MVLEGATFSHERGDIDVYRGACGAIWAPARERGANFRYLGASLMPMTMGWRPCAIELRLMKVMGRLHRRTVELHCGTRVIRKVMVLR